MLDRVSNMSQASDRRLLEFVWGLNSDELKKKKNGFEQAVAISLPVFAKSGRGKAAKTAMMTFEQSIVNPSSMYLFEVSNRNTRKTFKFNYKNLLCLYF